MYLLLLLLFANKKCHGYTFLMFFNLLDLLVKKLKIAEDIEAQERRLIKREEELRRREEALEKRGRAVSPLSDGEGRVDLFVRK